jgi:hypothetical protein
MIEGCRLQCAFGKRVKLVQCGLFFWLGPGQMPLEQCGDHCALVGSEIGPPRRADFM